MFFRAPLVAYGVTTAALALLVAHRAGLPRRAFALGIATGVLVTALYLVSNFVRFGAPFDAGYANILSSPVVNRLTRWGLDFAATPFGAAAKELFATLFLLRPGDSCIIATSPASIPASVARYAVGERWREYYSPTFDLWVFAAWVAAFGVVAWRIARRRLWRRDRDLATEVTTVVGLWALPPSVVLFVFYARVGELRDPVRGRHVPRVRRRSGLRGDGRGRRSPRTRTQAPRRGPARQSRRRPAPISRAGPGGRASPGVP